MTKEEFVYLEKGNVMGMFLQIEKRADGKKGTTLDLTGKANRKDIEEVKVTKKIKKEQEKSHKMKLRSRR